MRPALGVLCYHRVFQSDDEGRWPYLERGTAVRASVLAQQLDDVSRFADVVGEDVALDVLARRRILDRPAVWFTFDDGYRDIKHALPLVRAATVFVTTCSATRLLPADAWYAVLLAAKRTSGHLDLGLGAFEFDLSTASGRARLVNGPERRAFLRSDHATQSTTVERLSLQLDASVSAELPYATDAELRAAVGAGWSVGSHGVTHTPFDTLAPDALESEAATSRVLLRAFGNVRSIALPDGSAVATELLRHVGYECVLGLGDAPCVVGGEVQPRFLVPDDPTWVNRVLKPALTGAVDG